jgi:hypothetical protein
VRAKRAGGSPSNNDRLEALGGAFSASSTGHAPADIRVCAGGRCWRCWLSGRSRTDVHCDHAGA